MTEKLSKKKPKEKPSNSVAIVGIGCRFPGADNPEKFWSNLQDGINSIAEIPKSRWDASKFKMPGQQFDTEPEMLSKWCGLVNGIEYFDNKAFNISAREAINMDPQQRILLEEAWHCIEDSGIPIDDLKNSRTAVIIGSMTNDYHQDLIQNNIEVDSYSTLGNYDCILANRISHYFGFNGVSLTIDTACSSSLTAIHLAKASILSGENDYVIVGGVNLNINAWKYLSFSKAKMLSVDGQCKTFDQQANGYVPGDGIGVILLQSLPEAIKSKSNIYAIVRGTASNHCGGGASITAPSVKAQNECIQLAYKNAGLSSSETTYAEVHGTGTSLGDPIEMEALSRTFPHTKEDKNYCAVGSVKTNIGHLEAAAGIAGVIKVALMMKHQVIPATLNLKSVNPLLNIENSAFYIAKEAQRWLPKTQELPLRASVSSMGFGGANAHVVLESYMGSDEARQVPETHLPFLISAKSEEALTNTLSAWKSYLSGSVSEHSFRNICITATVSRSVFAYRFATFAKSNEDIITAIDRYIETGNKNKSNASGFLLVVESLNNYWKNLEGTLLTSYQKSAEKARKSALKHGVDPAATPITQVFLEAYCYLNTLFNFSKDPNFIGYNSDDLKNSERFVLALMSLCLSGVLTLENALKILLNANFDMVNIVPSSPKIPLVDVKQNSILLPVRLTASSAADFVAQIISGPTAKFYAHLYNAPKQPVGDSPSFNYLTLTEAHSVYVDRAVMLKKNQHTFMKYIAEWDGPLAHFQMSVDQLFTTPQPVNSELNSIQTLSLIIAYSAIRQVEAKWSLTDQDVVNSQAFNEISLLLLNSVLTKDVIVNIFLGKENESACLAFAEIINENQLKVIVDTQYPVLRNIARIDDKNHANLLVWLRTESVPRAKAPLSNNCTRAFFGENGISIALPKEETISSIKEVVANSFNDFVSLWRAGVPVTWTSIYPAGSYKRVPLPKYIFNKNIFWYKPFHDDASPDNIISQQRSDTLLLNAQSSVIRDHMINHYHILPAALYVQFTLKYLLGLGHKQVDFKNIYFISPGKIVSDSLLTLVNISPSHVKIKLDEADLAVLQWSNADQTNNTVNDDAAQLVERLGNINNITKQTIYRNFLAAGYGYGETLQVIKDYCLIGNVHYFTLECHDAPLSNEFRIAEIIDGCLQAVLTCCSTHNTKQPAPLLLPCFIKKLNYLAALESPAFVAIHQDDLQVQGSDVLADFKIFNSRGLLALQAEGARFKLAPDFLVQDITSSVKQIDNIPVREGSASENESAYLYSHTWNVCEENNKFISQNKKSLAIIFSDEFEFLGNLLNRDNEYYENIRFVRHDDAVLNFTSKSSFGGLTPQENESLTQLLLSPESGNPNCIDIYWKLPDVCSKSPLEEASEEYKSALMLLLDFCSYLVKKTWKTPVTLTVIARASLSLHQQDILCNSQWGGLPGFLAALKKEKPTINFKFFDIEHYDDILQVVSIVANEIEIKSNSYVLSAIRNGDLYKPALSLVDEKYHHTFKAERGDVYIITGGHKGIGLKISNYLIQTYGVKIVAIGRSSLSNDDVLSLLDKPAQHSFFFYESVDVSDFSALEKVYKKIKQNHGVIKGVIHSSGLIYDRMFASKNVPDFQNVFNVKVNGVVNLDRLTRTEPLDMFMTFSSVVATWGNVGQSDYALANATMDNYISLRKQLGYPGKNMSIRWSLWQSGGMGLNESVQNAFELTSGVLSDGQGINAFIQSLSSDVTQLTVAAHPIETGVLTHNAFPERRDSNVTSTTAISKAIFTPTRISPVDALLVAGEEDEKLNNFAEKIYQDVCEIFSVKLGESIDSIDDNASFFELGVESIVLKEIMSELDKRFDNLPATLLFEYSTIADLAEHLTRIKPKDNFSASISLANQGQTAVTSIKMASALDGNSVPNFPMENKFSTGNGDYNKYFNKGKNVPIAIVGLSGQFPKANDLDQYWDNLLNGVDCIEEVPKDRWNINNFLYTGDITRPHINAQNTSSAKWGGFIEDIDKFDSLYFNIPPLEAEQMDPQQRLFLQCAAHAMEHAGYGRIESYKNKSVGVFVGVMWNEYSHLANQQGLLENEYKGPGSIYWAIANRVSYFLNLQGPSLAIDTACSSSLTSVILACQQIATGECEMAIAGGINLSFHPSKYIYLGQAKFLATDGRCRSFGEGGSGYVPGEGVGAIVLKSLSDAQRDGDYIYGVIQGLAMNHGGKAAGFTVPNPEAQANLVSKAIASAGISSQEIDYVESHGTGTSLGDPIEIQGLSRAFGPDCAKMNCPIGSVKSNIGHLEAAAGIAALIKVTLSYRNNIIPKSLHSSIKNPNIDFLNSPFRVVETNESWPVKTARPRYASISSFGAGGSNAHIIMASYDNAQLTPHAHKNLQLFVISAEDNERLQAHIAQFIDFLQTPEAQQIPLSSIAYTMQAGRREMDARCAVIAADHNDLYQRLKTVASNGDSPAIETGIKEWKRVPPSVVALLENFYAARAQWQINENPAVSFEDLSMLASCWVKGATIDWKMLHSVTPGKVGLPVYPFAKERYWLTPEGAALYQEKESSVAASGQRRVLHPLIDENISTLAEQVFSTTLSVENFYLKDHLVYDSHIFPGAAYLELIFAATNLAAGQQITGIRDIMWARPIMVESSLQMQVVLTEEQRNTSDILTRATVYTLDGKQNRTQHAVGTIEFNDDKAQFSIELPVKLSAHLPHHYGKTTIYEFLTKAGFGYGKSFQVMDELWAGKGAALAKLVLPISTSSAEFFIHPSLMDGALRTSFAVDNFLAQSDFILSVPFSLKRIRFFQALPSECYAYATLISANDKIRKYNILLLDAHGNCLVHLEEFTTRMFAIEDVAVADEDVIFANWRWQPSVAPENFSKLLTPQILVIAADVTTITALAKDSSLRNAIGVVSGVNEFRLATHHDSNIVVYELDAGNGDHWNQLLKALTQASFFPEVIFNLLPLAAAAADFANATPDRLQGEITQSINSSLIAIVKLFQAYNSSESFNHHKVRVHNLYSVTSNGQPQYDALAGLARALVSVNHNFKLLNLGIDNHELNQIARALTLSLLSPLDDTEQRIVSNQRETRRKSLIDLPSQKKNINAIRHHGVYVITGGLGGIGLSFARYLASKYSARLVLNGRSELDGIKQTLLDELATLGAEVLYVAGDITHLTDCENLFVCATSRFGEVNGIFHAAGVLGKAPLATANLNDFFAPIAPKLHGTLNIDWVTRNYALDLFVLFSSVSVHLGDFGTGSYATGNKFMDSFAELRERLKQQGLRRGHSLSINWPLWDEGGMNIPVADRSAYFNYSGMQALTSEEGIHLFEQSLKFSDNILLIAKGDREKMLRVINIDDLHTIAEAAIDLPSELKLAHNPTAAGDNILLLKTENYLKTLFAKQTGFALGKINSTTDWGKYGIDSVKIMDMNVSLQRDFGSLPGTLFFEYSTIQELTEYFIREHRQALTLLLGLDAHNRADEVVEVAKNPVNNIQLLKTTQSQVNRLHIRNVQSDELASTNIKKHSEKDVDDIAIIGMAGIYPKARDLKIFWQNLCAGLDCITEVPAERWSTKSLYGNPRTADTAYIHSKWGGFIDDADKFDPYFFGIAPAEAKDMSPQERLFLQTSWHAMENSGYSNKALQQLKVGVFAGVMWSEYRALNSTDAPPMVMHASVANRVSFALDLKGPSLAVDTMCSSSLTAIHLACESLRRGESHMAFAGGVNLSLHPDKYIQLSRSNFLSSDGRCRSFGDGGDGYVPGEGVGVLLLKTLTQAIADGDTIQAVIKSSAINHGGRANAYTVPNPNAQREVISEALTKANIPVETISFVEAHGTGTPLGDPIEIAGLTGAFAKHTAKKQFCALGSAKSLVGHLEAAAGVCAITKVVLQMQNKMLPPSLHNDKINKNIDFSNTPFVLQAIAGNWKNLIDENDIEIALRAGVSSFGAGGSNAHIVLEEAPRATQVAELVTETKKLPDSPELIVVSAKTANQLWLRLDAFANWIEEHRQSVSHPNIDAETLLTSRLYQMINNRVSDLSGIPISELTPDLLLEECGVDRITLIQLIAILREEIGPQADAKGQDYYDTLGELHDAFIGAYQQPPIIESVRELNTLKDIAFTLQTGRDAMEFRLAFVAETLDDLQRILRDNINSVTLRDAIVAENAIQIDNGTYFGVVDDVQQPMLRFGDGIEDQNYLNSVLSNKNWSKISRLWISGVDIEWLHLYQDKIKPKKVALPGYPFLRERFWFSETNRSERNLQVSQIIALHPLLDKNVSTLQIQAYQKTLNQSQFYVRDHCIAGKFILPGAAYLEMAAAAAKLASGMDVTKIADIRWLAPLKIEHGTLDIHIQLHANNSTLGFAVVSLENSDTPVECGRGNIEFEKLTTKSLLDWETIKARCTLQYDAKEAYEAYANAGYNYGESFQVTRFIWSNELEALSHLQLAASNTEHDFNLHPALLDGVLRSVLSIGDLQENCHQSTTLIPFSLASIAILAPLSNECVVHTRFNSTSNSSAQREYDITVAALDGTVILDLQKLVVLPARLQQQKSMFLAEPIWQKQSRVKGTQTPSKILAIGESTNFLANGLPDTSQLINVNFSAHWQKLSDNQFCVSPDVWEHYTQLLDAFDETGRLPDHYIVLAQNRGTSSLNVAVGLCRALLDRASRGHANPQQLLFVYPFTDEENPHHQMIAGLFRAVQEINPAINCVLMGSDQFLQPEAAAIIVAELGGSDKEIRYLGEEKYVRSWREIDAHVDKTLVATTRETELLKNGGNYVISGGLGGLGFIFALHLINQYRGNVLLLGRSTLESIETQDEEKLKRLKQLLSGSSIVRYASADIANLAEVEGAIDLFRKEVGKIDGVFHAAGVLNPTSLLDVSHSDFDAALHAKLVGSENLDLATRHDSLDLFILFSSISSQLGDFGSGSYSAANRFMDSFSQARRKKVARGERSGFTLSINWPLWAEGGMSIPSEKQALYYDYGGMSNISTDEGIALFYQALKTTQHQIWVSLGDVEKIRRILLPDELLMKPGRDLDQAPKDTFIPKNSTISTHNQIEEYLIELIAEHAHMPKDRVKTTAEFHSYGINSIMIVAMNERLKKDIGKISDTLFFEFNSIDALTRYLSQHHAKSFQQQQPHHAGGEQAVAVTPDAIINHRLPQPLRELTEQKTAESRDIAIIGISGKYPQAKDMESFWDILKNGIDCITEVPPERWNYHQFLDENSGDDNGVAAGKTNSKWGGFLSDIDLFDPQFFSITPKEADQMSPQERLFLETAWHTLQDAGCSQQDIKGASVGVFVGAMWSDYNLANSVAPPPSTLHASIANRVSYVMDIKGPSVGLDSMCSSSLTAIHLACESILAGDCEMAFAGGVNLSIHPNKYVLLSRSNFLSSDGRCRSFGKDGSGYVPGEGVGAVLLKPLARAIEEGDHIYGVIKGSAINHVGKTNGFTVPSPTAQSDVISMALRKGNIVPTSIGYIEAHGTGTSLGDPIELNGLNRAFTHEGQATDNHKIFVGSVKSNMGHLEAAAGMCALTKVLLQFKHAAIAPSLHAEEINPRLSFTDSPFQLVKTLTPWAEPIGTNGQPLPRRAGISSFGASGSNAHVIVEEFKPKTKTANSKMGDGEYHLIPLSAKSEASLFAYTTRLKTYLLQNNHLAIDDIAFTLQIGRDHYDCRYLLAVKSVDELVEALESLTSGSINPAIIYQASFTIQTINTNMTRFASDAAQRDAAEIWVTGESVTWSKFYERHRAAKISLPGYVFDHQPYWLGGGGIYPLVKTEKFEQHRAYLHPLLHENISTISEQKFSSLFNSKTDFFLADHRVKGTPVLPASASLEMALVAGKLALQRQEIILSDVMWLNLATSNLQGDLSLVVSLIPEHVYDQRLINSNSLRFNIYTSPATSRTDLFTSLDATDDKQTDPLEITLISSGLIVPRESPRLPASTFDVNAIEARLTQQREGSAWYQQLQSLGLSYGESFRVLQHIRWSKHEALALLQLDLANANSAQQFFMHPALLDAAFQTAFALIEACIPLLATKLALPSSISQLKVISKIPANCFAYVTWVTEINEAGDGMEQLVFDVKIISLAGQVCAELDKFSVEISLFDESRMKDRSNARIQEIL